MTDTDRTYDWGFPHHNDLSGFTAYIGISDDARCWETPPYLERFTTDQTNNTARLRAWQNREPLRDHLLRNWPEREVDAYLTGRARQDAEREARKRWEATLRGRIITRYRRTRNETRARVRAAWAILRHGEDDL
ncbi:hypothetical protein HOV03_gp91 [Gordonia phage Asapag]|uniref:Uncharacterized protein n=1 Tax=Gordonia phage Asapag TaxID=2507862 RepID=A0A410TDY8_9CAUD|nr:hypothetical protein HOV03_gp91 [Gordonia phage Asapag]QAU07230.1 hypothetical protein SEA_ASAPAG_91 [Gordonia phage Asapag]